MFIVSAQAYLTDDEDEGQVPFSRAHVRAFLTGSTGFCELKLIGRKKRHLASFFSLQISR